MITCDQTAPVWFQRVLQQINRALSAIRPDNAVQITGGTATLSTSQIGALTVTTLATLPGATALLSTSAALTNYSSTQVGTLTNAPTAGNPTKWFAINDAGTIRYVPSWT